MKARVFADTGYFVGLLNPVDQHAAACAAVANGPAPAMITSDFVLIELAAFMSATGLRVQVARAIRELRSSPNTVVVPASRALLDRGLVLYESMKDKQWSLTDCTSFIIMKRLRLRDALTADRHFEQAGFRAVLK